MIRFVRLVLAAGAVVASTTAGAHALLVASVPARGQTLEAPPTEIRLTFNEHVEPRFTRVKLVNEAGQHLDADRAQPDKNDPNSVTCSVPVLKRGTWRAAWTAVGTDGHKTHGDFSFTVH